MATDAHSRLVTFAKLVLPLVALAILSTIFLLNQEIDPEDAIPYADIDVEEAAREQRLTNARYATVGTDGALIELVAREARPDPQDASHITAITVSGVVTLSDGTILRLSSGGADVNTTAQTAGLTQDALLDSSSGYHVAAPQFMMRLDRAEVSSNGPVSMTSPFGTLDAGNMLLTRAEGPDAPYRMLFNNHVRLVYVPPKQE